MLRGRDAEAPVLLYVHGGPGVATLPLSKHYADRLEAHFVVVHWDQRGAGASCAGVDPDTLTLDRIVADAIELSEKLAARPGTTRNRVSQNVARVRIACGNRAHHRHEDLRRGDHHHGYHNNYYNGQRGARLRTDSVQQSATAQ